MIPFEGENLRAYTLLLRIEIALRECLKAALEAEHGRQWQKTLHGDLLKKIRKSQTDEYKPQFNFIRLGPLYYLTFGELLTQLQHKHCRSAVEMLGGDSLLKQLETVFAPRNALCHSRPVSSIGLRTIETLYAQMETALTADGLARLTAKPDTGLAQSAAAKGLIPGLNRMLHELSDLPLKLPIPELHQTAIIQFWWADDSLAGFNRSRIEAAVELLCEYNALPAGVGSAGARQRLCEQRELKRCIQDAVSELEKVAL
jgi:hypothetical protein